MAVSFDDDRLDNPAARRNRAPILEVLAGALPEHGTVLEIGAGCGLHAVYFAPRFPGLTWLTSDPDEDARRSIAAWAEAEGVRLPPSLDLDAAADSWPLEPVDAVVSINVINVSPWSSCLGLIRNSAAVLPAGGLLYLYGAFRVGGKHTAESNAAFDNDLRRRNPEWGVRNLDDVAQTALDRGFQFAETVRMPSNNLSVLFRRKG